MDFIVVGQVLKAQGIRGELKIKPLTDDASRFRKLRTVYFDDVSYRMQSCRISDCVYLKLEGIDTRNAAENFIGKYVSIDRMHAVTPKEGSYFIADLLGCNIVDESGIVRGVITDIDNYGAADVVTARDDGGKIFRFPFLNKLILSVDLELGALNVVGKEFEAVCVYED